MNLDDIKTQTEVYVVKGEELVGTLRRENNGCAFIYDDKYLEKGSSKEAVAYTLPLRQREFHIQGDNLPAFFAGLLPEGRRLSALISLIKTSPDDMFSLLLASGEDCIGDVFVSTNPELKKSVQSPQLELSEVSFNELFETSVSNSQFETRKKDISIPGVQPKVSTDRLSLPVSIAKKRKHYLLKLAPTELPNLVENEHFFMKMAAVCGLEVAKTTIVHDRHHTLGLLVERFDRHNVNESMRKIHQEDACQFLNRYPQDKYRLSMREVAEGIERFATSPIIELAKLLELTVFNYLVCNGDMHAKNISLATDPESGRILLTPAYDIVSTLPYGDQTMALALEGKKGNLRTKDFIVWAARGGVPEKACRSRIKTLVEKVEPYIEQIEQIGLDDKKTTFLKKTMRERLQHFASQ